MVIIVAFPVGMAIIVALPVGMATIILPDGSLMRSDPGSLDGAIAMRWPCLRIICCILLLLVIVFSFSFLWGYWLVLYALAHTHARHNNGDIDVRHRLAAALGGDR